ARVVFPAPPHNPSRALGGPEPALDLLLIDPQLGGDRPEGVAFLTEPNRLLPQLRDVFHRVASCSLSAPARLHEHRQRQVRTPAHSFPFRQPLSPLISLPSC